MPAEGLCSSIYAQAYTLSHSEQGVGRGEPSRMEKQVSVRASLSGHCLPFVLDFGGLCAQEKAFEEVENPPGAGLEREKEEEVDPG